MVEVKLAEPAGVLYSAIRISIFKGLGENEEILEPDTPVLVQVELGLVDPIAFDGTVNLREQEEILKPDYAVSVEICWRRGVW